jgi:hypothetical protein
MLARYLRFASRFLCVFLLTLPPKAWAFGDNVGINAAREISRAIENSMKVLETMQQRFGVDLSNAIASLKDMEDDAINRIDKMTEDRVAQIGRLVEVTLAAVKGMEDSAFAQINNLVTCTPQIMTKAIEDSLSNLRVFGWNVNYRSRADLSPAVQYFSARDEILKSLEGAGPDTRAEGIMAAYDEISRLAVLTQCHYKAVSTGIELVRESKYYADLAAPWSAIIRN